MNLLAKLYQRLSLFACVIIITTTLGCASPGNKKTSSGLDEEAYIDFKQGFSLVVPSAWKRQRIPVSSPQYQTNTVKWLINNSGAAKDDFQVSIQDTFSLHEYVAKLDNDPFRLNGKISKSIQHSVGQVLRWESEDNLEKIILLAIMSQNRTYVITSKIALTRSEKLLPTIEKVFSSFAILPN